MNIDLDSFHAWLRLETPAQEREITERLDVLHRAQKDAYSDWPKGSVAVSKSLRELEIRGMVRKDGSDWHWVSAAKASKPEPQMSLFG